MTLLNRAACLGVMRAGDFYQGGVAPQTRYSLSLNKPPDLSRHSAEPAVEPRKNDLHAACSFARPHVHPRSLLRL
jgi:hypothetical protein